MLQGKGQLNTRSTAANNSDSFAAAIRCVKTSGVLHKSANWFDRDGGNPIAKALKGF